MSHETLAVPPRRGIVLVGLMGSGKSSVGQILAQQLGCEYWDSDAELRRAGQNAAAIDRTSGDAVLHDRESENLLDAMHRISFGVFGAAASVVLDGVVVAELPQYWVVWLRVSVETLVARLQRDPSDRPLVQQKIETTLTEMSRARNPLYEAVADQIIDADFSTPDAIARDIASFLPADLAS